MTKRILCAPAMTFAPSYIEALHERYHLGDDPPYDSAALAAIAGDVPAHLAEITRQNRLHRFADGTSAPLSPFSLFWFIEGGCTFLGSLHVRHELANDYARLIAGHVRYGVRPSRWNQGLGTELLIAGLAEARAMGHRRILVVCRDSNVASRRLIERCGGVFENSVLDPYGEGLKRRYRIAL